jgi:hypothetical protein
VKIYATSNTGSAQARCSVPCSGDRCVVSFIQNHIIGRGQLYMYNSNPNRLCRRANSLRGSHHLADKRYHITKFMCRAQRHKEANKSAHVPLPRHHDTSYNSQMNETDLVQFTHRRRIRSVCNGACHPHTSSTVQTRNLSQSERCSE